MSETIIGGAIGLILLLALAAVFGRANDGAGCNCNGDCRQGRDCPARKR